MGPPKTPEQDILFSDKFFEFLYFFNFEFLILNNFLYFLRIFSDFDFILYGVEPEEENSATRPREYTSATGRQTSMT